MLSRNSRVYDVMLTVMSRVKQEAEIARLHGRIHVQHQPSSGSSTYDRSSTRPDDVTHASDLQQSLKRRQVGGQCCSSPRYDCMFSIRCNFHADSQHDDVTRTTSSTASWLRSLPAATCNSNVHSHYNVSHLLSPSHRHACLDDVSRCVSARW